MNKLMELKEYCLLFYVSHANKCPEFKNVINRWLESKGAKPFSNREVWDKIRTDEQERIERLADLGKELSVKLVQEIETLFESVSCSSSEQERQGGSDISDTENKNRSKSLNDGVLRRIEALKNLKNREGVERKHTALRKNLPKVTVSHIDKASNNIRANIRFVQNKQGKKSEISEIPKISATQERRFLLFFQFVFGMTGVVLFLFLIFLSIKTFPLIRARWALNRMVSAKENRHLTILRVKLKHWKNLYLKRLDGDRRLRLEYYLENKSLKDELLFMANISFNESVENYPKFFEKVDAFVRLFPDSKGNYYRELMASNVVRKQEYELYLRKQDEDQRYRILKQLQDKEMYARLYYAFRKDYPDSWYLNELERKYKDMQYEDLRGFMAR